MANMQGNAMASVRSIHCMWDRCHGDTVQAGTEVLEPRESRSRPNAGIVSLARRGYDRYGGRVAPCRRSGLRPKRIADAGA